MSIVVYLLAPIADSLARRCRIPCLDGPIAPPWTAAVKATIWTSPPKGGARHSRRADLRPVLSDRPWRRDLRRALDAADHPQPVAGLWQFQRNSGGCARALPHPALAAAEAPRKTRHR